MTPQEKAEATPDTLRLDHKKPAEVAIIGSNGELVGSAYRCSEHWEENARRLVACWNALQGIPTQAIEAGAVQRLVESVKAIQRYTQRIAELEPNNALPAEVAKDCEAALTPFLQKR